MTFPLNLLPSPRRAVAGAGSSRTATGSSPSLQSSSCLPPATPRGCCRRRVSRVFQKRRAMPTMAASPFPPETTSGPPSGRRKPPPHGTPGAWPPHWRGERSPAACFTCCPGTSAGSTAPTPAAVSSRWAQTEPVVILAPSQWEWPWWCGGRRGTCLLAQVGCGAGNTVRPLLQFNLDPTLFVYACDYAASAVDVVRVSRSQACKSGANTSSITIAPRSLRLFSDFAVVRRQALPRFCVRHCPRRAGAPRQ
jgi:hypothetical protein